MTLITALDQSLFESAASTIALAFNDDPMFKYIEPDAQQRGDLLAKLLSATLSAHLRFGVVDTIHAGAGVALWLPPDKTEFTFFQMMQSGMLNLPFQLGLSRFGRVMHGHETTEAIHKTAAPNAHWYLAILAVNPNHQGGGIGSSLLKHGLQRADTDNMPVYLETFNERSLSFYSRYGFEVFDTGHLGEDQVPFWGLLRNPQ